MNLIRGLTNPLFAPKPPPESNRWKENNIAADVPPVSSQIDQTSISPSSPETAEPEKERLVEKFKAGMIKSVIKDYDSLKK